MLCYVSVVVLSRPIVRGVGCCGDFGRWALRKVRDLLEMRSAVTTAGRRFSPEFKDELCQEVISTSKTIKAVAVAYGVSPETLRNWLIKYRDSARRRANNQRSDIWRQPPRCFR